MKYLPRLRVKRYLMVLTVILIASAIGSVFYVKNNNKNGTDNKSQSANSRPSVARIDYSAPTKPEKQDDDSRKSQPTSSVPAGGSSSPTPEPISSNVTITRVTNDTTNKSVTVGTLVGGATSGECTVHFTKAGSNPITETKPVVLIGNNYACPNFIVPYSSFPSSSSWTTSVSLNSNGALSSNTWAEPLVIGAK